MTIQDYISKGYTIVSEGEQFVTLKKEKSINIFESFLFVIGFPLLIFAGIGLICWGVALINYLLRSDTVITIEK